MTRREYKADGTSGDSHNLFLDMGVACTVCSLCDDSSSCALTTRALLLCVCYTSIKRKKLDQQFNYENKT